MKKFLTAALVWTGVSTGALTALPSAAVAETTFRIGLAALPNGNGNPFASNARTSAYTHRAMIDTLTQLGPNLKIGPNLATAWRRTDDVTWVITLREGVRFSNGEVFDAEAAEFSFHYLMSDAGVRESLSRDVKDLAGVEALDSHTLQITTVKPMAELPRLLAVVWMVPPAYWLEVGRDGFALAPLGTGPFKLREWTPTRLVFDAHRESWRAPKVDKLEILVLPDMSSRIAALTTEQIDVASEIGPDDIPLIEAAGMTYYQRPPTAVKVVAFNTMMDTPLRDVRVRRALNYAVNKEVIRDAIMGGLAKVVDQMTASINPERHPDLEPYPYDPDKARALLAEAGYPDGFSFVLQFSFGTEGNHMPAMYQQVAADLARVGVQMEVRGLPWFQYVKGLLQGVWEGPAFGFEYEMLPTGSSMRSFRLHSCAWPYPWYCNEDIQPVIEKAKYTLDEDERIAAVHQVLKHYHNDAVALMLVENMGLDGVNPKVSGYNQEGGIIPYHDIAVSE